MSAAPVRRESPFELVARDVGGILRQMLLATLHPQRFTGEIGLAIHFKDGVLCHIRQTDIDSILPGTKENKPAQAESADDVDRILASAIDDLRQKLQPISAGYFGVVTLTIELNAGICRKVNWSRDRIFQPHELSRMRNDISSDRR